MVQPLRCGGEGIDRAFRQAAAVLHASLREVRLNFSSAVAGLTPTGGDLEADLDDLVDGLIRLMNQEKTVGPVNIGNPTEFTIKQLADLAIKQTGSSSKVIHMPLPGDDPKQRRPDITKARLFLGWEPKVPLEEGLVRTPTARVSR